VNNQCQGCTPYTSCQAQGKTCDWIWNGCDWEHCGTCTEPYTCNAQQNCECVGTLSGECGYDTCGRWVSCPGGYDCVNNSCQPSGSCSGVYSNEDGRWYSCDEWYWYCEYGGGWSYDPYGCWEASTCCPQML